jgi:hypothetical protein
VLAPNGVTPASFVGDPNNDLRFAPLGPFLFEPDPAVLASHLGGALAEQFGLAGVSAGIAYLTGPEAFDSPLLGCFAVDEVLPLDVRKIGDALRARGIGRLEIKKRGVDHDPETIRRQLKLDGDNAAVLILTKLAGKHSAILAQRTLNTQP